MSAIHASFPIMKAFGDNKLSRTVAECAGPYACERTDSGGCNGYGPSNQTQNGFLPVQGCGGKTDYNSRQFITLVPYDLSPFIS